MGRLITLTDTTFSTPNLPFLGFPTPAQLFQANLVAWWKMDTGLTATSSRVSSLADQSGTGITLAQATGTAQPLLNPTAANGLPGIRNDSFTAANATPVRFLAGSHAAALAFEFNQPFSVVFAWVCGAVRPNAGQNEPLLGQLTNAAPFCGWWIDMGMDTVPQQPSLRLSPAIGVNPEMQVAENLAAVVAGTAYAHVITYDGSNTPGGVKIYRSASASPTTTTKAGPVGSIVNAAATPFMLSFNNGGTLAGEGHTVLEAAVVNRVITPQEAGLVHSYMGNKFAIA